MTKINTASLENNNPKIGGSKRKATDLEKILRDQMNSKQFNQNFNDKIRRLDKTNIAAVLDDFQDLRLFNEFSSNMNSFSKKLKPYQKLNPFFNYTDVEYSKQVSNLIVNQFDQEFYLKKYNIRPSRVVLEKLHYNNIMQN